MIKMQMRSGTVVDILALKPSDFNIRDIAHSLNHICRFNGHTSKFYSVAQHSLHVSELMRQAGYSPILVLMGLLHDAHEAFTGDMVTPMKKLFPYFEVISNNIQDVIWKKYGLNPSSADTAIIKEYDTMSLLIEAKYLMGDPQWARDIEVLVAGHILPSRTRAKLDFINTFDYLVEEIESE